MKDMNIYMKINALRADVNDSEISKSGKNTFQNYRYMELSDFLPTIIKLNKKYGLYTHIDIIDNIGSLTVRNTDNPEEVVVFELQIPTVNEFVVGDDGVNIPVAFNNKVQSTGALETYCRRYLYLMYAEIAVPDEIDAVDNKRKGRSNKTKPKFKKTSPFVKPQGD